MKTAWLDKIAATEPVWMAKEKMTAYVVRAWEPPPLGRWLGTIGLIYGNQAQPRIHTWYSDRLGRGFDRSQLLLPVFEQVEYIVEGNELRMVSAYTGKAL